MTVLQAIQNADEIRPNAIPDRRKARFAYELEGNFAEMMGVDVPENNYGTGDEATHELLMPYPKDRVYELYIAAMIDHEQMDFDLYNADILIANDAIDDAKAWWKRTHGGDQRGRRFKVM